MQRKCIMLPVQEIQNLIQLQQLPQGDFFCLKTHENECSKFAFSCLLHTVKNSYKTYALVYILQIIRRRKEILQKPKEQIPKLLLNYIRSVSFTAVCMFLTRRIMCIYMKYTRNSDKSISIANSIAGLYLGVESRGRQIQIALYALNKSIQTAYNCYARRGGRRLPNGQAILFAFSMAIICYHYFNNKENFRSFYQKALGLLFKEI